MTAPFAATALTAAGTDRPETILLVDDDPTMRLLVGQILGDEFGPTVEAENGRIALDRLSERDFRLAIVDLDMPVLDGFGVIANARATPETRYLPIIVVTSRDDVVAIERAFALGATSFICKPLNWNIFRHQVRYVLEMDRIAGEARRMQARSDFQSEMRSAGMKAIEAAATQAVATAARSSASGILETVAARVARIRTACDVIAGEIALNRGDESARALVDRAVEQVEQETGQPGRIVVQGGDPTVLCDRALTITALAEILRNALLHSSGDVRVAIVPTEAGQVRFEIADRGPGMAEATVGSAMQPFSGGTDTPMLGIAMARAIIERHQGHFGILSEPGSGTEAFLTL